MTHRTLNGLRFKVWSPSHYELCERNDFIALVAIHYVPRQWWIDVLLQNGASHHKGPYHSLEHAINVIAGGTMERSA